MTLFSFSIPEHVPLILSGTKAQTTRIPRKPRKNGAKPYSVGELAQLYYRSRQKPSCHNCIIIDTPDCRQHKGFDNYCKYHSNFFGESVITGIIHYWNPTPHNDNRGLWKHDGGDEIWQGCTLGHLDDEDKDRWAQLDGFPKGWDEANDFFLKSTGDKEWMYHDLDVIKWNGQQIARRVS